MAGFPQVSAVALVLSTLFTDGNAQCFSTTINCQGASSPLDAVSDCCVGNGISYNDGSGCRVCYVIGYSEASRDLELDEGQSSTLTVEVIKPAPGLPAALLEIAFQIDNSANTADVRVGEQSTPTGMVVTGSFGRSVSFTIRAEADQIGQEGEETFTIPLSVTSVGLSDPVFVLGFATVNVTDLSIVIVELTEADYLTREGQGSDFIVARVSYSRDIANPITVRLIPVTYTEFAARGFTLPPGFPSREEGSEFEATVADFDDSVITVTLSGPVRQLPVDISIVDDRINEHQETFVGYIVMGDATDPSTIELGRNATQLIIRDNDDIVIGFTQPSYTFPESDSGAFITLAKDSGIVSERNDIAVSVSLTDSVSATQSVDFTFSLLDSRIDFDFEQQTFNIPISIINDELPEGTESFTLSVRSVGFGFAAQRQDTFGTTEVFIEDDDNVVVGLEVTFYEVQENVGTQQVCVRVFSPPDSAPLPNSVVIVANTMGGTANSGSDFGPFNANLPTFDQNNRRRCFNVQILEDNAYENTEEFEVTIASLGVDDVTVMPIAATIRIIDMDELTISLQPSVYIVNEGQGQVTVCAEVFEGIVERDTVVSLSTSDSTAENVEDYLGMVQLFTFRAGTTPVSCTRLQIVDNSVLENDEVFGLRLTTLEPRVTLRGDQGVVMIIDDDTVRVGFEEFTYNVNENGGSVQICVVIDEGQVDADFTVTVGTADDTALAGQDYTALQNVELTFNSTSTRECTLVSITNDQIFEEDEIFIGRLSSNDSTVLINQDRDETRVFIADDDRLTIGFRTTSVITLEGAAPRLCAAVLSGTIGRDVSIDFATQDQTAQAGSDYFTTNRQLEFDPANTEWCVDVQTVEDTVFENPEQFRALLTGEVARLTISPDIATVTIEDDESIMVRIGFVRLSYTVVEGDGNVEVEVELLSGNIPVGNEVVVTLSTADSSARASSDYQSRTNIPLTFSSTNNRRTVSIPIIDDSEIENVEVFLANLVIDGSRFPAVTVSPDQTTVNIVSDDVRIGFVETAYAVSETDGGVSVDLRLLEGFLAPELGDIIVGVDTNDITASDSLDYNGFQTQFTFNADNQGFSFSIPIIDDQEIEPTERFTITATTDRGQFPGVTLDPSRATVDIEDNDDVTIGLDRTSYTTDEDSGTIEVCARLIRGSLERLVTVELSTTDSTAISSGANTDFTASSVTLTFDPSSNLECIDIPVTNDDDIENDESFLVGLMTDDPDVTLDPRDGDVLIVDDDDVTLGFEETLYSVDEDDRQVVVCVVVVDGGFQIPVMTTVNSFDGSATSTAPIDYSVVNEVLTFQPGGSTRECVNVPIREDNIDEENEDFTLRLITTQDDVILNPDSTRVVINDDDAIVIGFELTSNIVSESVGMIDLCAVIFDGSLERNVDVVLATQPGTAQAGVDYSSIRGTTLRFSENSPSSSCVNVSIREDNVLEDTEMFTVTLTDIPSEGIVVRPDLAAITISDVTEARFGFEQTMYSGAEGTDVSACVVLRTPTILGKQVILTVTSEDISANAPGDYVGVDTELTFQPGDRRDCVTVTLNTDNVLEEVEQLRLRLDTDQDRLIFDPETTIVNVITIDGVNLIGLEDPSYTVNEDDGELMVCAVVIGGTVDRPVTVVLSTQPGTASSGADYTPVTVDLEFESGSTRECTQIPIVDDLIDEEDEMFDVILTTNDPDMELAPENGMVTIIDDDVVTIGLERTFTTVDEDDGTVEVCASIMGGVTLDRAVRVALSTLPGTATAIADYTAVEETLTFDAGTSRECVDIPVAEDDNLEEDEGFDVILETPDEGVILRPPRGNILIIDMSDVQIGFEETEYSVSEEDGSVTLFLRVLSGELTSDVEIGFSTDDGSATSTVPHDYTFIERTLTFEPSNTRQSVTVNIINDDILETIETLFASLSLQTEEANVLVSPDRAQISIIDNDGGVEVCGDEIDAVWEIQWPNTLVGEIARVPCGVHYIGNATRMCGAGGVWADPDVIGCSSRVFFMVQVQIAALLGEEEVDVEETLETFEGLVEVTEDPLFPADINTTIENVDTVLSLLEEDAMDLEVENVAVIFEVLDNLLVEGNLESFNILENVGGSQRVLNNVERYALYVSQALQNEGGDIVKNQAGENIVLRAGSVRVKEDETFPDPAEVAGLNLSSETSASITLPSQLLASRSQGGRVGVASVLFRNLQAFLPDDSDTPTLRSLVISGQVGNEGGNGVIDPVLEDNPVIITFSFEAGEDEDIGENDVDCVFWDFGGNAATCSDAVRWSTDGLRTESVTRDGNTVTVTCASFHLTSFAVLVDVGGAQLEDEALQIVSYIGLAISLACLLLTIIFFLSLGKKLFSAVHNFVHLNLAISLFIGYLVFAVGIELASHDRVACSVVTALIQYFLLAAFCWMMCEGIMLYLMLVVVFSKLKKKWWFFALLGWGIPVIFVVIGLASVHDEYGVKADDESHDYYKYCWLSSGNGTNAIWTFVAPVLAIILINTVFLVLVLYSIFKNRAGRQQKVDQGFRVDAVQYVVKASVILLPLLGLTWVFGLFAVSENTAVFAWLFTILNSLQGLLIFILHVLRNDRIWGRIKKEYKSYSASRASKSTDSTGVKSGKYRPVSSTTSGIEMKEKQSLADPEVSEAVDDKKPTKEELA